MTVVTPSKVLSPTFKPPKKNGGQIVVVESLYHQSPGEQPKVVSNGYVRAIETEEQVFGPRRLDVGEEWVPLECGWVKEASLLAIKNEEGRFTQTIPTKEEVHSAEARVLELGVAILEGVVSVSLIPAQQSIRLIPSNLAAYRIRCRKGAAKFSITLFPA